MILVVQVRELSFQRTSKKLSFWNCGSTYKLWQAAASLNPIILFPLLFGEHPHVQHRNGSHVAKRERRFGAELPEVHHVEIHNVYLGAALEELWWDQLPNHYVSLVFNYPGQFRTIQDPIGSITIKNKPRGISNSVHEPLYPLVACQQALQRLFQDKYPIVCQDHENDQHAPKLCDLCKYIPHFSNI